VKLEIVLGTFLYRNQSIETDYHVEVFGMNSVNEEWQTVLNKSDKLSVVCKKWHLYCDRGLIFEKVTGYSNYNVTFTFEGLTNDNSNKMSSIYFNFLITNCSSSTPVPRKSNSDLIIGTISLVSGILVLVLGIGLVVHKTRSRTTLKSEEKMLEHEFRSDNLPLLDLKEVTFSNFMHQDLPHNS